ncbi:hypothetical protein BS17DRAFT_867682 [Gyrodon lividus]|nr:hypothetical protein BS17DRAFT_867682 [Gyrodon lividus]
MSYVSEPHIDADEEMRARADGQFGVVNYFQWTQLYSKEFEYAVSNFTTLPGSTFTVGKLCEQTANGLDSLYKLAFKWCTFLDIYVFMDFIEIVQPQIAYPTSISQSPHAMHTNWMGAFTTDTKICKELFNASMPIWLKCHEISITDTTNISKAVTFTMPDAIIRIIGTLPATPKPTPSATSQISLSVGKAADQGKNKKAGWTKKAKWTMSNSPSNNPSNIAKGSRDKWQELTTPEMPPACSMWWKAIDLVDKNSFRVKCSLLDCGYCVLDPAILLTSQSPDHKRIVMANWLTVCPLWLSHVNHNPPSKFPAPQLWRDFLNSIPSQEQLDGITAERANQGKIDVTWAASHKSAALQSSAAVQESKGTLTREMQHPLVTCESTAKSAGGLRWWQPWMVPKMQMR